MKKLLLISCLILFAFLSTFSIAKETYSTDTDKLLSKMKSDLNLTDEQVIAVKPIIKEDLIKRQKYLESLESEAVTSEREIRQTIRQLRREENEKLSKVLTKEQMDKLVEKQTLKDKLNRDKINYKEYLQEGVTMSPQGGSFQF